MKIRELFCHFVEAADVFTYLFTVVQDGNLRCECTRLGHYSMKVLVMY